MLILVPQQSTPCEQGSGDLRGGRVRRGHWRRRLGRRGRRRFGRVGRRSGLRLLLGLRLRLGLGLRVSLGLCFRLGLGLRLRFGLGFRLCFFLRVQIAEIIPKNIKIGEFWIIMLIAKKKCKNARMGRNLAEFLNAERCKNV